MCGKRVANLKNVIQKPARPVQPVTPEPAVPRQPSIGAPQPNKAVLRKANTIPKVGMFWKQINNNNASNWWIMCFINQQSLSYLHFAHKKATTVQLFISLFESSVTHCLRTFISTNWEVPRLRVSATMQLVHNIVSECAAVFILYLLTDGIFKSRWFNVFTRQWCESRWAS